ncbi:MULTISPECIES: hypothetical protein [unclassified Actinotalea]|uniref:hypothetical protein n=1 Tax=unclassified Actinotalea TaxID=2638618 RepID=UPI0015F4842B|nr:MULTISPECIES: hypothetical protein [unclassified Actinotalea]
MTTPDDEQRTWAGNRPLTTRWWWSPALMIVVGAVVIGYQVSAYVGEGGIFLNGVMIVIGAAVMVAGFVSLRRAHREQRATVASPPPAQD